MNPPLTGSAHAGPITEVVAALGAPPLEDGPPIADLVEDMCHRWDAGERPLAEDYLNRHSSLWSQPGAALKLIFEEHLLREKHGQSATRSDYFRRFPQWQIQLDALLTPPSAPSTPRRRDGPPTVGDRLGGFHLLAELGRGALGWVFLARQADLADRPVVLKVTPVHGDEHLSLARLQHTNIVPLYWVQHDVERDLRVLCMPWFGGAALSTVLEQLRATHPWDRSGKHLADALERLDAATPVPLPGRGAARQFLARSTYPAAMCWIAACLADALDYAHQHDLVHLDIKPSNVLLAGDGQPMLLDFHLARPPLRPGDALPATLGGTLAYMPREQHAAMGCLRQGKPLEQQLDGRADLYALGAMLYGALGGQLPVLPGESPPLCEVNPTVSVGLSDVVGKCLAAEANDRYPDAATLAADLRRHLTDQPLTGVRNRSLKERWQKWRRRRPHGLTLALMLLAVLGAALAAAFLALSHFRQKGDSARVALADGLAALEDGRPERAAQAFRRGLALAEDVPFSRDLSRVLREHLDRADRMRDTADRRRMLTDLRAHADRVRFLYGSELPYTRELREFDRDGGELWQRVGQLRDRLTPEELAEARADLLDLAVFWCDLHVWLATDEASARRRALEVLDEAERLCEPSHLLHRERALHAAALGQARLAEESQRKAEATPPRTAAEHYVLGQVSLRRPPGVPVCVGPPAGLGVALLGGLELLEADAHLRRAAALQPEGLWPNYYLGLSAYRAGRYDEAVAAFSVCVGAAPDRGALYSNRALAHAALGREEKAISDLEWAMKLDRPSARPGAVFYNLAVERYRAGDPEEARRHLRRALGEEPGHAPSRQLMEKLR